jgi:hypothetical protein
MQPVSDHAAVDFRAYRLAWLPVLLAVVILMFSLEGAPDAIEPAAPPGTFEPERATREARAIVATAPEREPGSEGDELVADLVADRFSEVAAGALSEQRFDADAEGEEASVRNVLLTLPGDAESAIVVLAPRDAQNAPAAASSAAATGILVELARALGVSGHAKTIVFASTSGGAAGAEELLAQLPERDSVQAVIAITQPGSLRFEAPFVVASSTDTASGPVQLERTAELAVESQAQRSAIRPSAGVQLARLAIPSGLGPQAPLIAAGFQAVAVSSAGERPLAAADDDLDDLSPEAIDAFGRTVQATVGAVDIATTSLDPGPGTHLELGDNLVSGWTLALLALTLLLPALVTTVDACARAARGRLHVARGFAWAAARALPFIGALAAIYLLALVGLVPRPRFPFDPGLYALGGRAIAAFVLALLALGATAALIRLRGVIPQRAPESTLPALGAVAALAALAVWLANPYLALFVAPTAHVWLVGIGARTPLRRAVVVAAAVLSLVPLVLALIAVSSELELGGRAPWTFTLMIADGQIGFLTCLAGCFIAGSLAGAVAMAIAHRQPVPADA